MMRGFAAVYVMAGHLAHHFSLGLGKRVDEIIAAPFGYGQEAVMLFFLISGFVIFYSTEKKKPDFKTYFSHRWKRIYPIFLVALLLGSINILSSWQSFPWRDFFGNLFMLQDWKEVKPGVWFESFGGDLPLWSLAYEWWFYLLFYPIWRFVPLARQRGVAILCSLAGLSGYALHPNQPCLYLLYFILWWTGAEFARQYVSEGRVTFLKQKITVITLAGFVIMIAGFLIAAHHYNSWQPATKLPRRGIYPYLQIQHFLASLFIVGGALMWRRLNWFGFNKCFGIFALAAPISYGLYAFHFIFVTGNFFLFIHNEQCRLIAVVIISFIAAWLAEVPLQNFFKRIHFPRSFRQAENTSPSAN